jgi:hypothetical protein
VGKIARPTELLTRHGLHEYPFQSVITRFEWQHGSYGHAAPL